MLREAGNTQWTAYAELELGIVRISQGNAVAALPLFEESSTLFKELGDGWGEAIGLFIVGAAAYLAGDPAAARAHFEDSARLFREQGDILYASAVLGALEVMASTQGDDELAHSLAQELKSLLLRPRNRGMLGLGLINIGDIWLHQYGDVSQAELLYQEGLSLWQDLQRAGSGNAIARAFAGLAEGAAARGQAERAGRLFGAAAHLLPCKSMEHEDMNRRVAAARVRLERATFEAGWSVGQEMTEQQALMEALEDA